MRGLDHMSKKTRKKMQKKTAEIENKKALGQQVAGQEYAGETKKALIRVEGMMCEACERRVETAVRNVEGVKDARADCSKNCLAVEYASPAALDAIRKAVCAAGYDAAEDGEKDDSPSKEKSVRKSARRQNQDTLYILVIILGLYVIATQCGLTQVFQRFPTVSEEKVGYAVLFVIGLFTSVHCIAMCGGINLTQSVTGRESAPVRRNLLYNAGRLVGYTMVGGVLGLIGEAASVTLRVRGLIGVLAGVFMVLTGVNMLGNFGFLKKVTLKMPKGVANAAVSFGKQGSFAIGIVNAFMPCGPLQSMQLYAIAAGGFAAGAFSMFFFCLGTIPLMLIVGLAAGFLKKKNGKAGCCASVQSLCWCSGFSCCRTTSPCWGYPCLACPFPVRQMAAL